MRHLLLAAATSLALAATANAQYVIDNGNVPSPGGAYYIATPPFYNGLAFNNGVITAFPVAPRYGDPYHGYPAYPALRPNVPGYSGYNPYPSIWRP